jgi:hypothetical protein
MINFFSDQNASNSMVHARGAHYRLNSSIQTIPNAAPNEQIRVAM